MNDFGTALYTTEANVSAITGTNYGTATTPTSTQISTFIDWASREVDMYTDTYFGTALVTQEVQDFDVNKAGADFPWGNGMMQSQGRTASDYYLTQNSFRLNNWPVISIGTAEYNTTYNASNAESWTVMTEGTGGDFIANKDIGKIILTGNVIPALGYRRFRFTYVHGHTSVPKTIERLTTLLVAKEIVSLKQSASNISTIDDIRIGPIAIGKGGSSAIYNLRSINSEIESLMTKIGINKVELI